MGTPSSGPISMTDVFNETNLVRSMYNFYSVSQVGGGGGLMYHNINMAPGNNVTAKNAIYDPFVAGAGGTAQDLKLENWYNYYQGPTGIFDITFTNSSPTVTVQVDLYLGDPYQALPRTYFPMYGPDNGPNGGNTRYTLNPGNGSDFSQTNVESGVLMTVGNFGSGSYVIYADLTAEEPPPPPPGTFTTVQGGGTASDTDGVPTVPAGTNTRLVPTVIGPFDATASLTKTPIVRGIIPGGTGDGIFMNKRTSFTINFT